MASLKQFLTKRKEMTLTSNQSHLKAAKVAKRQEPVQGIIREIRIRSKKRSRWKKFRFLLNLAKWKYLKRYLKLQKKPLNKKKNG